MILSFRHTDTTMERRNLDDKLKEYTTRKLREEWAEHEEMFQLDVGEVIKVGFLSISILFDSLSMSPLRMFLPIQSVFLSSIYFWSTFGTVPSFISNTLSIHLFTLRFWFDLDS